MFKPSAASIAKVEKFHNFLLLEKVDQMWMDAFKKDWPNKSHIDFFANWLTINAPEQWLKKSFNWQGTPQGLEFWHGIDVKWQDYRSRNYNRFGN